MVFTFWSFLFWSHVITKIFTFWSFLFWFSCFGCFYFGPKPIEECILSEKFIKLYFLMLQLRAAAFFAIFSKFVNGHGYLAIPKSRNVLNQGGSYGPGDIQSLNGGGKTADQANGHGVCGDYLPRNIFEAPNPYGPAFPTVATYVAGQFIDITIVLTAHHYGWFEFRLCRNADGGLDTTQPSTQDCLNQHVLEFDPVYTSNSYVGKMRPGSGIQSPADYVGDTSYYSWEHSKCPYLPSSPVGSCCNNGGACSPPAANKNRWVLPDPTQAGMTYQMRFKLPDSLSCPRCVLQWYYQTGNSPDGYPEGFWNCADITILDSSAPAVPTVKSSASPSLAAGQTLKPTVTRSVAPTTKAAPTSTVTPSSVATGGGGSGTTYATCGASAFDCGASSPFPLQQPMVPDCLLQNGEHCCCYWGMFPSGNGCGCGTTAVTSTSGSSPQPTATPTAVLPTKTLKPTTSSPSRKPSRVPSSSPTKKVPTAKTTIDPSATPSKLAPSRKPSKMPSAVPACSSPTLKPTILSTSSLSTLSPSSRTTTGPSSGGNTVLTVTICGTNAFICPSGSPDPHQPAIPNVVVASGGQCCCFWGYFPYVNAGCTNQPVSSPTQPASTSRPSTSVAPPASPSTISYVGWYKWSWTGTGGVPPAGMNLAVAFTGWASVSNALSESSAIYPSLKGLKFLSIGGGNGNGAFTAAALSALDAAVSAGSLSAYNGICYDIEEGDGNLAAAFATSFANAKKNNLMVFITVSHSAPYGVPDKVALMNSFFSNPNVDIISPQLYTSGSEAANDYVFDGVPWSSYATTSAAIVPSIAKASYYSDAQNFFSTVSRSGTSITIKGFVQWQQ